MREAFLQAIRDAPGDDVPRLVYADWLEENGQPERAELIRVQCALTHGVEDREEELALLSRMRALVVQYRQQWLGPLAEWAPDVVFERGFVERVTLRARTLVKEAALFDEHPIWSVRLTHVTLSVVAALVELPELARLRELDLRDNDLGDEGLAALLASPHLTGLRLLDLRRTNLTGDGAQALAACPRLAGLKTLYLQGNWLRDAGARALAGSEHLGQLRELVLWGNRIGDEATALLFQRFRGGVVHV
jgi:uncharacterized protein (TIGR02996 family)